MEWIVDKNDDETMWIVDRLGVTVFFYFLLWTTK